MRFEFSTDGALDGETNMARDASLLEAAETGRAGCRVYSWDGPWVSLGRFQSAVRDLAPGSGVPWAMRPTGGKAVLHGHDVTVGLAAPLGGLVKDGRSMRAIYRAVVGPLVRAMRACGLPAAIAEETRFAGRGSRTADCFAHVSPNDVVDEHTGVKVCGCALRVTADAVLMQASIPAGRPLVDPGSVIVGGKALAAIPWERGAFAGAMARELDALPSVEGRAESLIG